MIGSLNDLITGVTALAGGDDVAHSARMWRSEGGRPCPIGWNGCSQAVYTDTVTGEYDYGEPGGPGYADCQKHCEHGMEPCSEED